MAKSAYRRHELRLQVNHIQPLVGSYRGVTCMNHLSNLEVLCHQCHVAVTDEQRRLGRVVMDEGIVSQAKGRGDSE